MHDILRDRILRQLEVLPDERLYQVLDYIEFLGSKYARENARPASSPFQRFGERLEDKLRGNRVGFSAIRSTLEAVGTADRMVSGLAEAGRSLIRDVGTPPPADIGADPEVAPTEKRLEEDHRTKPFPIDE